MHRHRGALALSGLLAALACGTAGDAESAARAAVNDSGLIATLRTDRPVYRPGEPVTLTLTLRNATSAAVTLEFVSAQRYDFTIVDAEQKKVRRWSMGKTFAQMLGEETLAAGDSMVYRERFTDRLAVGSYLAVGTIVRMGAAITATAEVTVR